jgi:sporulation protein YlmC with PRC-barrel domain
MLRSLKDLERYTVSATDGDIGSVKNFLLDDEHWTIRYLVVDTVEFLDGRQVLISPISFRQAEWSTHRFHLALTMADIENCPSTEMDKPVSRQHEQDFNQYYGYPPYWGDSGVWGLGDSPAVLAAKREEVAAARAAVHTEERSYDAHLRSTNELRGYHIQGTDEAIGHIEDFIVDDETWEVRYLVIDTSNWWFGKRVLIAPRWASRISWEKKLLYVEMSRDSIKNSPELDPSLVINREYETHLYAYFGRPAYWTREDRSK